MQADQPARSVRHATGQPRRRLVEQAAGPRDGGLEFVGQCHAAASGAGCPPRTTGVGHDPAGVAKLGWSLNTASGPAVGGIVTVTAR